jgi:DNA-binding NtrC family response regulator
MARTRRVVPAHGLISELLKNVLPGDSKRVRILREQVLEFCCDLSAKTLLIRGPIGAGKSTVARVIGFVRRVAPLSEGPARRVIGNVRYDGPGKIDFRLMTWYVELALTGLSEGLAESQLFGVAKGAATDVGEKPGIFELASRGRAGGEDAGAAVTGGVVFLDEIGDLPNKLQGKLLPVLSGGVFYRTGGEGDRKYELTFMGVTITASWKALDDGSLRGDLLSRITQHVIDVPGLGERQEDLAVIVGELEKSIVDRHRAEINRVCGADAEVDRGYWRDLGDGLSPLTHEDRRIVREVDWSRYGNMRGLTHALERIVLQGADAREVVESLQPISGATTNVPGGARGLLASLLARRPSRGGLALHLREVELEQRRALRKLLQADSSARASLVEALKLEKEKIVHQMQQLDRSRRQERGRRRK